MASGSQDAAIISRQALSSADKKRMVIVLFACNILASFLQFLMNVALDQVSEQYHVRLSEANLLVLGFSIVAAVVIVMASSLLARFGLKRMTEFGLIMAFIGSVLGAFAWCFPVLVIARLIQAITTGLFFPLINEALLRLSPKGKAGHLLAMDSGVIGIGMAGAPILAGLVITYWGLGALFAIPAVTALVLLVVAHFVVRDIEQRDPDRPIDIPSVLLSLAGLGAFMVGLNEVSRMPLPMAGLMVAGAGMIVLFALRQRKLAHPLLDLSAFKNMSFSMGETLIILSYMSSIYLSLLMPLYLEGVSGFTPFIAGCLLAPAMLSYAVFCFVSGKLLGRFGVWPLIPLGFAVCFIGFAGLVAGTHFGIIAIIVICMMVACCGIGMEYPAVKSVDLESLPPDVSSSGSSIHSTLVQIAGSVSSALFVGIMSGDVHRLMDSGIAKTAAYDSSFTVTLYLAIAFLVVAVVLSVVYARHVRKVTYTSTAEVPPK